MLVKIGQIDGFNTIVNSLISSFVVGSYLPLTGGTLTGNLTAPTFIGALEGNATTATRLQTARTIALSGAATGTATSFNGSSNITIPVTGLNASNLNSGTVPTARLGSGTANSSTVLYGNNTWGTIPAAVDTITRLRGTTSGTLVSGDITLLAGSNTTITQSGNNITIASTNTNTTYAAGTGITLSGTTFSHTAHTGDVTGATALTIANNAVTFTKMQNISTQRLLGRGTAGTGNIEELTLGTGLTLSTTGVLSATGSGGTVTSISAGNGMNFTTISGTGTVTLGTPSTISLTSTNSTTSTSHTHALDSATITAINNGNTAFGWGNHSGLYALVGRSIVAGNGLTGGGTLAANRTITLGTPGDITLSSTNSVSTSSHTHALDSATTTAINNGNTAFGWGNFREYGLGIVGGSSVMNNDLDTADASGFFSNTSGVENSAFPSSSGGFINFKSGISGNRNIQIAFVGNNALEPQAAIRHQLSTGYTEWRELIHTGNLDSQATTLGFIKSSGLSGYVPTSRTLTAGNGLSGGGNLTANRTFTLGTPSAITLTSTNSVTTSSHTHEFAPGGTTAQYIRGDGSLATYVDTTYTAGNGLTLTGTTFGQAITTSGTGTYVQSITQTASGFQVNLGTPPNTNTTYSLLTAAQATAGTSTTAQTISAKVLADEITRRGNTLYTSRSNSTGASSNSVLATDTRAVNETPAERRRGIWFDFKTSSVIGFTGGSTYAALSTFSPYSDASGNSGSAYRLAHSGGILAFQSYASETTWGPWRTIYHSGNFATGTTAQYIRGDGSLATYVDTTYTAGTGLSLSGTTFGQAITTSGTGTYVQSITQTASGFQVNLGTPPNTNTTYSNMAIAELNTGTVTTGRIVSASVLNQWLNGKGFSTQTLTAGSNISIVGNEISATNTDTITRLRGTTTGTYTSGDLTLIAGANTTITQSGASITIASTNTNTTYTGSTSIILSGTSFQRAALTGDVTAAQNSNATTIANNAVTFTKMQNIATQRILGRGATGTGNVQELTLGSGLSLSTAGVLSATNTNTTYSAGTGLSLTGTTFGQTITTSGTGTFVTGITQTTNGFQINLGTPPNTNTTYSAGTLALLQEGTNTSNRVWSPKILADGVIRKGVNNINPAGQSFSIHANHGTLDWEGNGFSFYTDSGNKFNYIDDEQAIGVNPYESYGFYLSSQRLEFTNNSKKSYLLPANGVSESILPITGTTKRTLAIGATNGSTTEYANINGIINISSLVNQTTGNFVSKSGVNVIDYSGWALDAGVRFAVGEAGINVIGNASTNPDSDNFSSSFEVNVVGGGFIGMYNSELSSGFKLHNNVNGLSNLMAPGNVPTTKVIPIGIRQNGDTFYADFNGMVTLPTSVSNTTFHNNTHNSTSANQTVTLTNTSYPRVERVFYGSSLCGTLTIRKYAPVDGDEIIVQGRQCTIVIRKSSSVNHTIFTPSSHNLVTSLTLANVCHTSGLQSVHLRYMSNYQSWVVLSASISNNGYFV